MEIEPGTERDLDGVAQGHDGKRNFDHGRIKSFDV